MVEMQKCEREEREATGEREGEGEKESERERARETFQRQNKKM